MSFNRFHISIIIQVILIGITTSVFVWTYKQEYMLITRYSLIFLWIIQLVLLIRYVSRISRDLQKFLLSIKYKDPTIKFKTHKNHPFKELHQGFEEILEAFGKVRIDKENEHQFFQAAIEHVNVGLLAIQADGYVKLSNRSVYDLLGIKSLVNISSLKKIYPDLPENLKNLKPNHPYLLTLEQNNKLIKLSFNSVNIKIKGELLQLISIQNITTELEQGEMDAWQKLIKIITHEILNSVSPINLLSSGLINLIEKEGKEALSSKNDEETLKEFVKGLKVIQGRSKGLTSFVEDYRSSMQIPHPKFEILSVVELFKSIETLFTEEFQREKIEFKWESDIDETMLADKKLIEQVLINLINNSIYFTKNTEQAKIKLKFESQDQGSKITLADNGDGIEKEIMDQIFIPFFSTKEKGSGIGLSLSRQIMRMHNGNISVQSVPGETKFILHF